jgi:hypothetical protein
VRIMYVCMRYNVCVYARCVYAHTHMRIMYARARAGRPPRFKASHKYVCGHTRVLTRTHGTCFALIVLRNVCCSVC